MRIDAQIPLARLNVDDLHALRAICRKALCFVAADDVREELVRRGVDMDAWDRARAASQDFRCR